mgnify:FL=1
MSPDPYSKRVLLNKGARDGVFIGQALLDANGLMGQVDEVLPYTAWVLLITDSHHVTPVEVNRNGERALARGSRTTATELELEFVTQTQDMRAGDRLVSSGMGQVYPKSYPVAEIISVYADPGQDFATVRARPLAQLESTRHVMLVYNNASAQLSDLPAALPLDTALEVPLDAETSPLDAAPEAVESATVAAEEAPLVRETVE